jgi:nitroreductase
MACHQTPGGGNFKTDLQIRAARFAFLRGAADRHDKEGASLTSSVLDLLLTRSSVPIHELSEPAPGDAEIETLIRAASRVPDHGRLEPWRFILYRGAARHAVGMQLAALAEKREGALGEARREKERSRFSRARWSSASSTRPRRARRSRNGRCSCPAGPRR